MVDIIDIHNLNAEELDGVISMYPWFGVARKELCSRMARMGALTDLQLSEAGLYIASRRKLSDLLRQKNIEDYTDPATPERVPEQRIFIAGGDYFSQSQYESVRQADDNIFSKFATKARDDGYKEPVFEDNAEVCTEILAQIYLEQGYPGQAIDIYSKLSLRYPEKSVYFATLIDEINKKNN